ncbi:MAG: hypothetical protein RSE93_05290 [Oscillospiraceae bacterium]
MQIKKFLLGGALILFIILPLCFYFIYKKHYNIDVNGTQTYYELNKQDRQCEYSIKGYFQKVSKNSIRFYGNINLSYLDFTYNDNLLPITFSNNNFSPLVYKISDEDNSTEYFQQGKIKWKMIIL